ncbi:UNVERIFIED_CONTAM: hypothetical protein K2H54_050646 [Gekko kuhli]
MLCSWCGVSLVFFKLKIKKAINFRHQSSISEKPKDPLLGKTSSGPEMLSVAIMERPGDDGEHPQGTTLHSQLTVVHLSLEHDEAHLLDLPHSIY